MTEILYFFDALFVVLHFVWLALLAAAFVVGIWVVVSIRRRPIATRVHTDDCSAMAEQQNFDDQM